MSIPVDRYFCSTCDYESSNTVTWGHFLYVLKNASGESLYEDINVNKGWCFNCERISAIESLPSMNELIEEKDERNRTLNGYKEELKRNESKLIKFSSTTSQNTFIPLGLHRWITCLGLPSEVIIKSTPNFIQLSNCLFNFMFDLFTIRFIPNPLDVVLFLISFIAFSSSSIVLKFRAGIHAEIFEFNASIIILVFVTRNIGAIMIGYLISNISLSCFI